MFGSDKPEPKVYRAVDAKPVESPVVKETASVVSAPVVEEPVIVPPAVSAPVAVEKPAAKTRKKRQFAPKDQKSKAEK